MPTPEEVYSAAIVRACADHLARVKAARDTRHLAVAMVAVFGEQDRRPHRARWAVYAKARKAYDKAVCSSEAQRMKDEAIAWATFQAIGEVSDAPLPPAPPKPELIDA